MANAKGAGQPHGEVPLICFTTCVPAAVGTCAFALALGSSACAAFATLALVTVGMLASVAHLARIWRAPRSLANLRTSWLSREILAVAAFWALVLAWCTAASLSPSSPASESSAAGPVPSLSFLANMVAALVGAVLIWVIARAYRVHGQPAWDGPDTLCELAAGALGAGGAVAAACAGLEALLNVMGTFSLVAREEAMASTVVTITPGLVVAGVGGCLAALALGAAAWRMRERRLLGLASAAAGPRVAEAQKRLQSAKGGLRRSRILALVAFACALVASFALIWASAQISGEVGSGAPVVSAAGSFPGASAGTAPFIGQLIIAAFLLSAVFSLAALAVARGCFYSLATRSCYAVKMGRR